jgi:hypothetical protein
VSPPIHGSTGTLFGASTAAPAFDVPDDVAAGDIIVVAAFLDGTSTTVTGMPADFEHALGSPLDVAAGGGFGEHVVAVMWKRATGADTGTYGFTLSGTTFVYGNAVRYEGAVGSGDPWDATDAAESGAVSVSTAPAVSVTTLGADRLLVYVATDHNGDSGTWSPPAGYDQRQGGTNTTNTEISDLVQAAAGSSGSVSATHTVAGFMGAWLGALIGTTSAAVEANAPPAQLPPQLMLLLAARQQRLFDGKTGTPPTAVVGSTLVALVAGPAAAVKVAQASGRAGLALAGGGTARKTAAAAGTGELAQRGTAAAAKTAPVAGRAELGLTGTGAALSSVARAQSGTASLAVAGTAAAGRTAACAGRASIAVVGIGASRRTAIPAGRAVAALVGIATAHKTAPAAGRDVLALVGVAGATKRATAAGRSELVLTGAGTVSPTGARPQTGRCVVALSAYLAPDCTVHRPNTGTVARGSTGTAARPSTGLVEFCTCCT